MRKFILAFTVCFLVSVPAGATELTGTPNELRSFLQSETRTVSIRKRATEEAYSDIARITLLVTTSARSLEASLEENNRLRDSVRQTLVSGGIDSDDIKSSKYSASPQYGWFGKDPDSYDVVNTLEVTVDSDAQFRLVAGIADGNDDVKFGSATFEHSEKEAWEDKVRDAAMQEIMAERAYFESELGLALTPITFLVSDVHTMDQNQFGVVEEIVTTASMSNSMKVARPAMPASFDKISYNVTMTVTFSVTPGAQ